MEPTEALAELLDLSSQIDDAAILGESGFVLASSGTPERGEELARVAAELVAAASDVRPSAEISRVEVSLGSTSLFVVREGGRTAVATTAPDPTAGLVVYDLRTALRRLDETPPRKTPPRGSGSVRPMRRLVLFAVLGGIAWWFIGRRREAAPGAATIGYADGSSVTLEAGSPSSTVCSWSPPRRRSRDRRARTPPRRACAPRG